MMSIVNPEFVWQGANLAQARACAYALLALALRPPVPDILEQLVSGAAWQKYINLCPEAGLIKKAASLADAAAVIKSGHGQRDPMLVLGVSYNRLFTGPGPVPAPPYGSIYLEGQIMGETTVAALQFYAGAGLAPEESLADLPDHAAVECEFLCEIIWREMISWEQDNLPEAVKWLEIQVDFLKNHLGRWFPLFAARLGHLEDTGLYRPLLDMGRSLIIFDQQLAAQMLETGHRIVNK